MKKILYILIGIAILTFGINVFAMTATSYQQNILPFENNTYDLGSTSPANQWRNLFTANATIGSTTSWGAIKAPYFTATSTSATSTFAGGLSVAGNLNFNGVLLQNNSPFTSSQWTTSGGGIYYNSGSAAVGTTTPNQMFQIWGTGGSAGNVLSFNQSTATTSNRNLVINGNRINVRYTNSNTVGPNAALVLQDDIGSGNVGIGSSSPSGKLTVTGDGTTAAIFENGGTIFRRNLISFLDITDTGPSGHIWRISSDSDTLSGSLEIADNTAGAQRFLINSSGNVEIGAGLPSARLDVSGPDTSSATSGIILHDSGGNVVNSVRDNGTSYYGIWNAVSATPAQAVFGQYTITSGWPYFIGNWPSPNIWGIGTNSGTADNSIRIGATAGAGVTWTAFGSDPTNLIIPHSVSIASSTPGNSRLTIDDLFNVEDAITIQRESDAARGWLHWYQGDSTHDFRMGMVKEGSNPYSLVLYGANGSVSSASSPGKEFLTITGGGNVGIGTTTPGTGSAADILDIVGGNIGLDPNYLFGQGKGYAACSGCGSFSTLQLYNAVNGNTTLNNQSFGVFLQTQGTNRISIPNSGYIGMGTDTPDSQLTIVSPSINPTGGAATHHGLIQIAGNADDSSTNQNGIELKTSVAGNGYGWLINSPDLGSSNVPLNFEYRNSSASWTKGVTIKSDASHAGYMGLGTTSPSQVLDVNGNINVESGNGIILRDTAVPANCYIVQITNGALAATAHACQ